MTEAALPSGASPRAVLGAIVERALDDAIASGTLPPLGEAERPVLEMSRPSNPEHGDYATGVALKLARPMRRPPLAIAEALAGAIQTGPASRDEIAELSVAPPGFLNFTLSPTWVAQSVDAARRAGAAFGQIRIATPQHINIEFVSANPTGPLTIGNARGAFTGDLLARVLEAAGHEITREYYFNDSGAQVKKLGESIRAVRLGKPIPEDGYRGAYVQELAQEVPEEIWKQAGQRADDEGDDAAAWTLGRWATERIRAGIETSLATLGVRFDVWTTERSLHEQGWVDRSLAQLRKDGYLYEQDGATWFKSTAFGDDKDRVVIRSNGEPTYVASDIGYLAEKFSRGFERLLYLWGQDHHGTVARLRNAAEALGYGKDRVDVILMAWVRFVRDGQEIPMSKRSGEFLTLDELLAEIGVDAARWFFGARSHNSGIDFDLELAKRQSNENPVYYVQYAHARISSILRKAAEAGLQAADSVGDLSDDAVSLGLAKEVLRLPEVVEDAALAEEIQGITAYATELATTFHAYYRDRRVIDTADPATSGGRLALVEATRLALANSLGLLGISAPESM